MKKRLITLVLGGVLAAGLLAGCGAQEEPEVVEELAVVEEVSAMPEVPEEVSAEPEITYAVIGEENEDAYQVLLTNSTGQDIVGVAICDMETEEYCDNMLKDDDVFAEGETRELYYLSEEADGKETDENADPDEKLLSEGYNIEITLADETVYVLHAFPFGEAEMAEILVDEENEVAYIEYNEGVSTLEAEISEKEIAEAAETTSNSGNIAPSVNQGSEACVGSDAPVTAPSVNQSSESCVGSDAPMTNTAPAPAPVEVPAPMPDAGGTPAME